MALKERFLFPQTYRASKPDIGIVFPDSYFTGMSSLAFHALQNRLLSLNAGNIHRFFFEKNILWSPENTDPASMDLFFITCSFEKNYDNLSKIKKQINNTPCVIGGLCPTYNPNYFKNDFTIVYRGDLIDRHLAETFDNALQHKRTITPVHKKHKDDKPEFSSIIAEDTEFSNFFLIEIGRGCRAACKFCLISHVYKPPLFFKKSYIIEILESYSYAYKKVGFIAPCMNEHPDIKELLIWCIKHDKEVGFSSLRIDTVDDEFIRLFTRLHQRNITFAPESFSTRIKKQLGKNIPNDRYLSKAEAFIQAGISHIRLYLLCGAENESLNDVRENIKIIKQIRGMFKAQAKKTKKMGDIRISLNPLIPKPLTPFKHADFIDKKTYREIVNLYKRSLLPLGNITVKHEGYRSAFIQYQYSKLC
ncbi:B12-binding domain-containing radical SAM protein [Spirochaetota bacterium]